MWDYPPLPTWSNMTEYLPHVRQSSLISTHCQPTQSPTSSKGDKDGQPNSIHPIVPDLMTQSDPPGTTFYFPPLPPPQGLFSLKLAQKIILWHFSLCRKCLKPTKSQRKPRSTGELKHQASGTPSLGESPGLRTHLSIAACLPVPYLSAPSGP